MTIRKSMFLALALCFMAFAQDKPKVAVYSTGGKSASENKALSNKMTNALVGSGKYRTIERSDAFLEQVAAEQAKQRQGAIDDRQISRIGKQAGAEYVCIAELVEAFGGHQISARIVNVETVEVTLSGEAHGTLNSMQAFDDIANNVIASMFGLAKKPANTTAAANAYVANAPAPQPSAGTASNIKGIAVPGSSLAEKLTWLKRSVDSHNTYIVEVNADESIAPDNRLEFGDAINVTIVLRGDQTNRTIRLKAHGRMFTINKNITFILENNITLHGHDQNTEAMISVNGGIFKMYDGATITGNITSRDYGGGVVVHGGTFEMNGGIISGNAANYGGGVYNYANTFIMNGGIITGNTARKQGGGVHIASYFGARGIFTKNGGIITGYNSDPSNGNVVNDGDGVVARNGHAVYRSGMRKETTAGPAVKYSEKNSSGFWDNEQ